MIQLQASQDRMETQAVITCDKCGRLIEGDGIVLWDEKPNVPGADPDRVSTRPAFEPKIFHYRCQSLPGEDGYLRYSMMLAEFLNRLTANAAAKV